MNCAGNATEICGGPNGLSLFQLSSPLPSTSASPVPAGPAYTYLGCQSDSVNTRTLSSQLLTSNSLTVELCTSFCAGYTYFGVEYGQECYCGNTLLAGSALVTDGRCSMTCAGNVTELCGGPNGLSRYELSSVSFTSITSTKSSSVSRTTMPISIISTGLASLSSSFSTLPRLQAC